MQEPKGASSETHEQDAFLQIPEKIRALGDRSIYVAPEIASFPLDELDYSEQIALTGNL